MSHRLHVIELIDGNPLCNFRYTGETIDAEQLGSPEFENEEDPWEDGICPIGSNGDDDRDDDE